MIHHIHHGTLEHMAGEIAHIVYAARVLTACKDRVSHQSYWVGAVFPDIYRIVPTLRYPTHPRKIGLASLIGNNDFVTGMRVHAWIDDTRRHSMQEHRAYERLPWHPLLPLALELFEDEMLYDAFEDWGIVRRALAATHPDELNIIHDEHGITIWHTMLEHYFRAAPSDTSRITFIRAHGISDAVANEVNRIIGSLKSTNRAKEIINGYISHIEHMLL